jgi:hypothetical protein
MPAEAGIQKPAPVLSLLDPRLRGDDVVGVFVGFFNTLRLLAGRVENDNL